MGASAGGVEALSALAAGLPSDLPAVVLVALHLPSRARSRLASILDRAGPLPASPARPGESLTAGRILVASPDEHLLVHTDHVLLSCGATENGHRPAIDPLFRSAARWLGPRAIAVILSGTLDDGAAGAAAIASQGGTVVVQDPDQALFDSMPRAALRAAPSALVLPAGLIGAHLAGLFAAAGSASPAPPTDDLLLETDMAELNEDAVSGTSTPGRRVNLSCPACHGALNEVRTGPAVSYRCHVGHAYGPLSLLDAQADMSEAALWTAIASLEEQSAVHRELAHSASEPGHRHDHEQQADEITSRAHLLRRQLRGRTPA